MDIVEEATKIIDDASKHKVVLRALGGVAIGIHCPSAKHRSYTRSYADIDLVGREKQGKDIRNALTEMGFDPNKRFNALHGNKRLQFWDTKKGIDIDIFLDVFEMCHKINLKDRLDLDMYTVPLADLLITKLQIVELNDKDVKDIMVILKDHDLGKANREKIDADYIAKLCSEDWGLYKTLTLNTEKIAKLADTYNLSEDDRRSIKTALTTLTRRIENAPKSFKWRMRARVGESKKWYETVEEVKR